MSTQTTTYLLDILKGTREILSDPARWTQNAWARNAKGQEAYPFDEEAVAFCLDGAIVRASGEDHSTKTWNALMEVSQYTGPGIVSATNWNDEPERVHADVLAVLDRAIAELSK